MLCPMNLTHGIEVIIRCVLIARFMSFINRVLHLSSVMWWRPPLLLRFLYSFPFPSLFLICGGGKGKAPWEL